MQIGGYRAIIQFDPDVEMFRGEFVERRRGLLRPRRYRSQE